MERLLGTLALGLLGVLVAVAITMAASSLSSQSIGISAEPTTAGRQLAVPERTTTTGRPEGNRAKREASSPRSPSASRTPPAQPTVDDDRGTRRRGRDHGGDDRAGSEHSGSGREDGSGDSSNSGSGSSDDGKSDDD